MNLKRRVVHFLSWWSRLEFAPFIGLTLLLTYLIMILMIPFHQQNINNMSERDGTNIITALFLSPIMETFKYQVIIIYLVRRFLTKNLIIQVLLSAIVFGAMHFYSWRYILYASLAGIILALGYILYMKRRGWEEAAWAIIIVHTLRNAIAFFLYLILR